MKAKLAWWPVRRPRRGRTCHSHHGGMRPSAPTVRTRDSVSRRCRAARRRPPRRTGDCLSVAAVAGPPSPPNPATPLPATVEIMPRASTLRTRCSPIVGDVELPLASRASPWAEPGGRGRRTSSPAKPELRCPQWRHAPRGVTRRPDLALVDHHTRCRRRGWPGLRSDEARGEPKTDPVGSTFTTLEGPVLGERAHERGPIGADGDARRVTDARGQRGEGGRWGRPAHRVFE